ncbi:hypothetical protein [Pseudogracilibacillus auburnensis]|uniref:hypothetical protein n=1 Tax=Pseudogracilibacillus auburnensis TaxID=1494959 RepID=UPI001A96BEE2|nr:hypothetical protein [Pseudogracilibacillus auburnensis]MBO1002032.1 hypothetical protein [Pseudogracilibacillus auburnensis]
MKNFFKLLNFEINRFMKLYVVLLVTVFVLQIIGTIIAAKGYMRMANNAVLQGGMSQLEFIETYEKFSISNALYSVWFLGPIAIGVTALLFYVFFIWYRDWFAKNTFIYRLLMLPTTRMNIFFTKATTIMLTVLGLVAFQIVLLVLHNNIIKWIVPKVYRIDLSIIEIANAFEYLSIIIPNGFAEFVIAYGLGFSFVVVIFTAILMERSFKLKGIILGLAYISASCLLFLSPYSIQYLITGKAYLYPEELFIVQIGIWIIIVTVSLIVSRYLLKNKVTV